MKFFNLFFGINEANESIPEPVQHMEAPEAPPNSTIILEEVRHAEIEGHPEIVFRTRERVYMGEGGQKCKITISKTPQASGCGHNLKSPDDVGFISHISMLPVCKICEQEYYRLREQTRNEACICRHLVAPHELTYLEAKGFVCEECKKKEKAITFKKVGKWLWGHVLNPLIMKNEPGKPETRNDILLLPSPGSRPSVSDD